MGFGLSQYYFYNYCSKSFKWFFFILSIASSLLIFPSRNWRFIITAESLGVSPSISKEPIVFLIALLIFILFSHNSHIWVHNNVGITPLSRAFFNPWVPVFEPLGADSWQGEPFLHIGLKLGLGMLVQISVGWKIRVW